jgi:benzylsuccinate CoA-transferase BbsF subunit
MRQDNQPILQDIRILDFSWVLAGPYATRLLADFGAEVIKIRPLLPEAKDKYSQGYYNTWNRNKLGITLDLSQSEGLEIAQELVKISDAVVENFSPRVMINWGLDYASLQELNPDIIMVSLSIMGHDGPWRDYVGFGPTAQAFSGITYLTGYPGATPSGIGFSYADHIAALYASLALLGALEQRRVTGKGQYIDLSETESMVSLLPAPIAGYTRDGKIPQPMGNRSDRAAPHSVYRCLGNDRWCAIAVNTEEEWEGFKRAMGNPGWAEDVRFDTIEKRIQNVEALDSLVQDWTQDHNAEEVMTILQKEGVPCGVVQSAAELAQDPQLKSRGFFIEVPESRYGDANGLQDLALSKTVADASPIRLSDNPAEYWRTAPSPGQDNDYVFRKLLGISEAQIKKLKDKRVI